MVSLKIALLYILTLSGTSAVAGTATLPSYPLAVKNPYLSTWVPGSQLLNNAATAQPEFWMGQALTWPVLARVNGITYSLFGLPTTPDNVQTAETVAVSYTSSHTYIQLSAGPATVTLDFFSPVLPGTSNYARQSLPYSYLTINATSTGSSSVSVQVMTAIDYTWTAQNGASNINYTTAGNAGFFRFYNPDQVLFSQNNEMAAWGTIVFATATASGTTSTCGTPTNVYRTFVQRGSLSSTSSCAGTDLAALARNLGSVGKSSYPSAVGQGWPGYGGQTGSVTFAVGIDRVNAINYLGQAQSGYYRSQWPTVPQAVQYFLNDYNAAYSSSLTLDSQVRSRAERVSSTWGGQYADIVEASVRQTFGALELTSPVDNLDAEPSAFLKEISSDGNVNTMDVIFQSYPIFLSLNPAYLKLLLKPILAYSALPAGQTWPKPWVIHDIGSNYPNATGHNNGVAEQMPLFETSAMFIFLDAYQKFTGDTTFAKQYTQLLNGWALYLATNGLYPPSQLISVDAIPQTPNQTALAMQSAIGLKAASSVTGNSTYSSIAASFANKIYNQGLGLDGATPASSTHFTYNYGVAGSWNALFASFSDVVLNLTTFPPAAWALQSRWYATQIKEEGLPFAGNKAGARLSDITWGLTDYNIVVAAVSSAGVQESIVTTTHTFMTNGLNDIPFGTKYDVTGPRAGYWLGNKARSTVGSHFAIMALQQGTWGTSL